MSCNIDTAKASDSQGMEAEVLLRPHEAAACSQQQPRMAQDLGDKPAIRRRADRQPSLESRRRLAEECLTVAMATGDVESERQARWELGNTCALLGEARAAAGHYETCRALARTAGDSAAEAQACWLLGNARALLRDYRGALASHERHLEIADQLGDSVGASRACWSLSNACTRLGDYERATHYCERYLSLCQALGDSSGAETARLHLADLRRRARERRSLQEAPTAPSRRASVGCRLKEEGADRRRPGATEQAAFWELVSRCQGRRMDEQRASLACVEELAIRRAFKDTSVAQGKDMDKDIDENKDTGMDKDYGKEEGKMSDKEGDENMEAFLEQLARSQGSRMDEQRASLPPAATLPDGDVFASWARRRRRSRAASLFSRLSLRRSRGPSSQGGDF